MIVNVKWVMLVCEQMFIVTLVFEEFGENINGCSGDAYL